jgi:hypothetical protein
MKRFSVAIFAFLAFFSSLAAQEAVSEVAPAEMAEIKKADVPVEVTNAVARDFKDYVPTKFSQFPYQFTKMGWFVNPDNKQKLDHYEVHLILKNGSYLDAVYSSNGDLIRYRQMIKNEALPENITKAIANSQYKDWTISGDHELIKGNPREMTDHYIVKIRKGNVKKNLYLDEKGIFLVNR